MILTVGDPLPLRHSCLRDQLNQWLKEQPGESHNEEALGVDAGGA